MPNETCFENRLKRALTITVCYICLYFFFKNYQMEKFEEFKGSKKDQPLDTIIASLKLLKDEVSELYLPKQVPVITEIPEPFEFYRNWVAPNIPVVIRGGIKNWDAVKKWSKEYFCEKFKDKQISVAVTPNGYADAIKETQIDGKPKEVFVLPEERLMTVAEFYEKLEDSGNVAGGPSSSGIFYIQKQNSNLTEEFPELLPDIDSDLLWAAESFQSKASAINLWIGDQRAVTSLHKDPFENIYCVISGHKDFILLPPTDRPWLPYKTLPVAQYKETTPGHFDINLVETVAASYVKKSDTDFSSEEMDFDSFKVPWIAIDPYSPDYETYPLYHYASPINVRVEEGDVLYLPSLWFHYVRQSQKCIAVNYWFDMNLDIKYAYFQLLEKLSKSLESKSV